MHHNSTTMFPTFLFKLATLTLCWRILLHSSELISDFLLSCKITSNLQIVNTEKCKDTVTKSRSNGKQAACLPNRESSGSASSISCSGFTLLPPSAELHETQLLFQLAKQLSMKVIMHILVFIFATSHKWRLIREINLAKSRINYPKQTWLTSSVFAWKVENMKCNIWACCSAAQIFLHLAVKD